MRIEYALTIKPSSPEESVGMNQIRWYYGYSAYPLYHPISLLGGGGGWSKGGREKGGDLSCCITIT